MSKSIHQWALVLAVAPVVLLSVAPNAAQATVYRWTYSGSTVSVNLRTANYFSKDGTQLTANYPGDASDPVVAGDTFTFNNNQASTNSISIGASYTFGILNIGQTGNTTYIYRLRATNGTTAVNNSLTFDNGTASSQLNVVSTSNGDSILIDYTGTAGTYSTGSVFLAAGAGGSNGAGASMTLTQASTKAFTISGPIVSNLATANSASARQLVKEGVGTVIFTGQSANTYGVGATGATNVASSGTQINNGVIQLSKAAGTDAIEGQVTVGTASTSNANATSLELLANNQISDTSAVTVNSKGTLRLNGNGDTVGSLTLNSGGGVQSSFNSSAATPVFGSVTFADGLALGGTGTADTGPADRVLTLADTAGTSTAIAAGSKFLLIDYGTTWDGGDFTVNGTALTDGGAFTLGANTFRIDYDGDFASGATSGGTDVILTAVSVPEPATLVGLTGLTLLGLKRSRRRSNAAAV